MSGKRLSFSVLVDGSYSCENLGDDALMVASFETLRKIFEPEEIGFICDEKPYLYNLVPEIHIASPESDVHADFMVYGGGTQFYSFPLSRSRIRWRSACNPIKVSRHIKRKLFAQAEPQREQIRARAAIGIGLGPFVPRSKERTVTERLFQQMDYIAVRDRASLDTCRAWGLLHAVLRSDLCFVPNLWGELPASKTLLNYNPLRIGIIVRDWPHSKEGAAYIPRLLEMVRKMRSNQFSFTFVSFCKPADPLWLRILEEQPEPRVIWDPERFTIVDFLRELAKFDCLLSARYHGVVFGALLEKPVISIEVEPKLRLVSELLFNENDYLWKRPFRVDECSRLIEGAYQKYTEETATLTKCAVREQGALAELMAKELIDFIMINHDRERPYAVPI